MRTCLHLLPDTREAAVDPSRCCGQGVVPVLGCTLHGTTTGHQRIKGYKSCAGCGDFLVGEALSVTSYTWLLPGIADPLPTPIIDSRQWWTLTSFAERDRHFAALMELARAELPGPTKAEGRGIVYVGGDNPRGDRSAEFGLQVAVGVRMARWYGYQGPVEWWFDSSRETVDGYYTPDMGDVRFRDFRKLDLPPRVLRGWPNKLTALANSEFREVLFLDADAYVVSDPDVLFGLLENYGFAYWSKNDQWAFADRITPGIDIGGTTGVQGGQFVIDRLKAWRLLVLSHWINQHSDYYYAEKKHARVKWHQFGDEDAWAIGLAMCREFAETIPVKNLGLVRPSPSMCNFHLRHKVVVVHRCNDKMHSFGWASRLPHAAAEPEARDALEEAIRGRERNAVGAPQGWRYRKLTNDLMIFHDVATKNEYRLPDDLGGGIVLDVGGNTGTFAWACHQRGAGRIVSVEPHGDNLTILRHNCRTYAEIHGVALWSEEGHDGLTLIDHTPTNTGDAKLGAGGMEVTVEGFDTFVNCVIGDKPIRFLKLDCEGAEVPILLTTRRLGQVHEIACEVHTTAGEWDEVVRKISDRLNQAGFDKIELARHFPGQGLLFAKR